MARLKQIPEIQISCCICLNQRGIKEAAVTMIKGYAVCDRHRSLVSQPEFDIFTITQGPRAWGGSPV